MARLAAVMTNEGDDGDEQLGSWAKPTPSSRPLLIIIIYNMPPPRLSNSLSLARLKSRHDHGIDR